MHAAVVTNWDKPPAYTEVPAPPPAATDQEQITVVAAGVHQVVRSRASGKHYSSGPLPHVPGVDGVGTTADGRTVYFTSFFTGGSFAETVNVPKTEVFELAAGADAVAIAGMVNPAMSSWLAVKTRVSGPLRDGFVVVVMGATSASGSLAASLMKLLGASKVIGVARNLKKMEQLSALDERIVLADDPAQTDFSSLGDVDIVLDYIYGPASVHLLSKLHSKVPTTLVEIGTLGGAQELAVPAALLRSKDITIRGSGPGSWSMVQQKQALPELLTALSKIEAPPSKVAKFSDVETAWVEKDDGRRLVFVP